MQIEIAWYAPTTTVFDLSDEELRGLRRDGVDILDPYDVAAHIASDIRRNPGRSMWRDVLDEWDSQEPPEIIDYSGWGDPPDWALRDAGIDPETGEPIKGGAS